MTVMYARSFPSNNAMRSRCDCTTSTGEIPRVLISRASSVMDFQTRSFMSVRLEHAVLGGRLDLAGQRVTDRLHRRSRSRDERKERRHLLIGEIEALKPRERGERLEAEWLHARRIAGHAFIDKGE